MRGVVRCSCQMSKQNKHDKWRKSFVIYLEPSIRRGKEDCVIMENVGQFPSSAIASPY